MVSPIFALPHAGEKTGFILEPIEQENQLTLNDHALAVGDVTYMALTMDNKEPEGQLARRFTLSRFFLQKAIPPMRRRWR